MPKQTKQDVATLLSKALKPKYPQVTAPIAKDIIDELALIMQDTIARGDDEIYWPELGILRLKLYAGKNCGLPGVGMTKPKLKAKFYPSQQLETRINFFEANPKSKKTWGKVK